MKTKFCWVALLASAAMIAQANAGGHHGGGDGFSIAAPARPSAPSFQSTGIRNFGGGRLPSGGRFPSVSSHLPSSTASRQHYTATTEPRFNPENIGRGNRLARQSSAANHAITNRGREANGVGQIRHGSNLPGNWRNHVVAQPSANWQRNWDRSRDHRWHGHHCRFVNGSWVIFDFGFYPWSFGYPYNYYYGYNSYPYGYDSDYYGSDYYEDGDYYDQNAYDSSYAYADSSVAAAQERLAQQGYYRGEIDGIFGAATRRALMRYQSDHGLRVTGRLAVDTLRALGLPRVASN
jgi:hypothetical protein